MDASWKEGRKDEFSGKTLKYRDEKALRARLNREAISHGEILHV
jgi:hypothetical protein